MTSSNTPKTFEEFIDVINKFCEAAPPVMRGRRNLLLDSSSEVKSIYSERTIFYKDFLRKRGLFDSYNRRYYANKIPIYFRLETTVNLPEEFSGGMEIDFIYNRIGIIFFENSLGDYKWIIIKHKNWHNLYFWGSGETLETAIWDVHRAYYVYSDLQENAIAHLIAHVNKEYMTIRENPTLWEKTLKEKDERDDQEELDSLAQDGAEHINWLLSEYGEDAFPDRG